MKWLSGQEVECLRLLRATGWTVHHFGPIGKPLLVGATLGFDVFVDVVVIRDRDDSVVYRVHVGSGDAHSQDVWDPETVEWCWAGSMLSTLEQAMRDLTSHSFAGPIPAPHKCRIPKSMRRSHRMLFPTGRAALPTLSLERS